MPKSKKLKWKYDNKFLKAYIIERWESKEYMIEKDISATFLYRKRDLDLVGRFKELKDAKKCAQLIHNG